MTIVMNTYIKYIVKRIIIYRIIQDIHKNIVTTTKYYKNIKKNDII